MKKTTLVLLTLLSVVFASTQVPQAMNYQAIARNSLGQIIPSQNIGVRFTITDAAGTAPFYQETHSTTTNAFGLFTLAIGKGTTVSGTIPAIDWSAGGDKYLKVEIAPQGGTNYTMQGLTQFLSVPYSLYSEKTRLIGGTAITITNGNTINANYQAGPGININGNTISATAASSWLLNGNTGTTGANFIGTTDNQRINFRSNNITRMYLDQSTTGFGVDLGHLVLSNETDVPTRPAQISVFGRDIAGVSMTGLFVSYVGGATWGVAGGNTLGRMFRLTQMATTVVQSHFYDIGISQDSSFFITNHGFQNIGGVMPKKMITISPQDMVGINLSMSEKPSASFHTKGTVRFEGLNTNNALTNVLVTDANGNVARRDVSTIGGNFWVADANGIHNSNTGHVGIGINSSNAIALNVAMLEGTLDGRPTVKVATNDSWQTNISIENNTSSKGYSLVVGGSANTPVNYGVGVGNFGVVSGTIPSPTNTIPFIITADDKVGISSRIGGSDNLPRSRLHVRDGDIYIDQVASGVIMKSPNGNCWRMTVSDAGTPVFTSIPCP